MKVGVIGCGMGGMAAAIALARRGHAVTIFEAFEAPKPLGSGLLLQPSGLAALRVLGLEEAAREAGARVDFLDGRDETGRRILDLDYSVWRKGTHGVGIRRSALFDLLYTAVRTQGIDVVTGTPVCAIEDFDRPVLRTEDGRSFTGFDLVVIADGSGSRLRGLVRPKARAPVYPWGAVWANCADRSGVFAGSLKQLYVGTGVMIGVLPVGAGEVSVFWSVPVADQDAFFSGDFAAWKARVAAHWPQTAPLLAELHSADVFARAVYRDVTVGRWHRGVCLLIGDAAHGTSPQLGQGANLAIIDGVELAERIGDGGPRRIAAYQAARRRQTALYQFVSRWLTPMFQSDQRGWLYVRDWLFTPLTRAPVLRWFVAGGLTGTARVGITPRALRL